MKTKMPLVSVIIPVYKVEPYIRECVDSVLSQTYSNLDVILVDDGSPDGCPAICDAYAARDPRVQVIHKENGGHGEAVNTGLRNAAGVYYKVVDSDDWLDKDAYIKVLDTIKKNVDAGVEVDMYLANYVYDKVSEDKQFSMHYTLMFDTDRVIGWEDMKHHAFGHMILMHSVIYRTELLRGMDLELPKHTFYVDNLFVYEPLPKVRTIYYMNLDLYHYYIGREGQSVNEATMVKRIDQQLRVNYRMIDAYSLFDDVEEEHLRDYMLAYLEMITVVSTAIGYVSKTEENLKKVKELWKYIEEKDERTYKQLRHGIFGRSMNLPGRFGRWISVKAYQITQKVVGFN